LFVNRRKLISEKLVLDPFGGVFTSEQYGC
jgi:hypothetical protein